MRDGAEKRGVKDVKLREVGIEDILKEGFGGEGREFETRATDVQMGFERWVSENETVSPIQSSLNLLSFIVLISFNALPELRSRKKRLRVSRPSLRHSSIFRKIHVQHQIPSSRTSCEILRYARSSLCW